MHVSNLVAAAVADPNTPNDPKHLRNCGDGADDLQRLAYSVAQAAKLSNISRSKLYELIKSGTLRSVKIAGRRLVTRSALLELLNAGAE